MVTYNYSITSDGPVTSIQEAINKINSELITSPEITSDIVINVGDGAYPGFSIPNGMLFPLLNSVYKLKIQSAGKFFPILDFNLGSQDQSAGIDIGSGNPNIVIEGLRIQYFPVGIRAGLNSHFLTVKKCIISNNRNVGILASELDEFQAIQNIVLNGDYGIVAHLCKNIAVLFNTVFQNGAIASQKGKSISAVWLELALDYGAGTTDTGQAHLIGNILWNLCGSCLTLFHDDVERSAIISNYNDIVSTENQKYIVLEDRTFYRGSGSRPRLQISNLNSWKNTGHDLDSISADPKFISPIRIRSDRNGYSLDLNLLPVSPVLGKAPSFHVDSSSAATWLPSYVDTQDLSKDILGNNRLFSNTALGANEKPSAVGFYGQDILSNPLDLNLLKNCEVDPLIDIVSNNLDIWFPSIAPGYFYSNEREYYLYSQKECKTLGQLATTIFRLPSRVAIHLPMTLKINGKESKDFDIFYDDLYVQHKDSEVITLEEEIDFQCWISKWNNNGFSYQKATYIFKFSQGKTKYYLNKEFKPGGPVVITDDSSALTDKDYIANREFTLKFDELEQKTELIFANNTNQIFNGQFDYAVDSAPYMWGSSGSSVIEPPNPIFPVAGTNVCSIAQSGYIKQLVKYTTGASTLSFHLATEGQTVFNYNFHCYDAYNEDLGFVITGSIIPSNNWERHAIIFGTSGDLKPHLISSTIKSNKYYYIPEETEYIDIKFSNTANELTLNPVYIDAVQYEFGPRASTYHRKPFLNELTVEYEIGEGNFIDKRQAMAPIRNYMTDGFLYIEDIPAKIYGGPEDNSITTLHEWRWQEGRKNIIPWSRTKGKDKLLYRPNSLFNTSPIPKQEMILPVSVIKEINEIDIIPSTPIIRQGDSNGIAITINANDSVNNPLALATYKAHITDNNLNYPGLLFKSFFGMKEQLGISVYGTLDNAGISNFIWIPPDRESSLIVTKIPKPIGTSSLNDRLCFIKTKYPVSLDNNGNVIILDSEGTRIETSGDYINITKVLVRAGEYSKVNLDYPITFGSVSVVINNQRLVETVVSTPESDQFYVDYENGLIIVKSKEKIIEVQYKPYYIIINKGDPYWLGVYFDKVFSNYVIGDSITIGYDYTIPLSITITNPATSTPKTQVFELIAQNCLLSENQVINSIALEI